jgi:predicted AAA+ superfamily ATPase
VALHVSGLSEPTGAHLENIVLNDLLCWRDARTGEAEILYWRTTTGEEVDFVIETAGQLLPVEVKATTRPRMADAARLRSFRSEYGKLSRPGLLLHTGTQLEWITSDVLALAAPWWAVC